MPNITVVVPGQQTVSRVISATGTLAARREMPVGVAGEGHDYPRPGRAGPVGPRRAGAGHRRPLGPDPDRVGIDAQVAVARSDQQIAQAELDRAQQLVDRGFISKADLQRRTATRDAAAARVRAAQASWKRRRATAASTSARLPRA